MDVYISVCVGIFWRMRKKEKEKASDSDECIYHFSVVLSRPRLEGHSGRKVRQMQLMKAQHPAKTNTWGHIK